MSFAFPAYHRQPVPCLLETPQAKSRAKQVATTLKWKIIAETDHELLFHVGLNWRSWGEVVKMSFADRRVDFESKCRLFTQCFDWGKNRWNYATFAKAYET